MLHSGILALIDKQTTDGSQRHLAEVTRRVAVSGVPTHGHSFPRVLLFPSPASASVLPSPRGEAGAVGSAGARMLRRPSSSPRKQPASLDWAPLLFRGGTLLKSPLVGAKSASPRGDGGGESRGGGRSGGRGDGGRGARVKMAGRERAERGLRRWEGERSGENRVRGAREQEPGSPRGGRGGAGNPEAAAAARTKRRRLSARSRAPFPGSSRVFRSGRQICWSRWGRAGCGSRSKGTDPRRSVQASRHSAPPRRAAVARAGEVGSGRGAPSSVQVHSTPLALFRKTPGTSPPAPWPLLDRRGAKYVPPAENTSDLKSYKQC